MIANSDRRLRIFIIIGAIFIIASVAAIILYFVNNSDDGERIRINNYSDYVKNIAQSERNDIEGALHYSVSLNTETEKVNEVNDAVIRDGSYNQEFEANIYTTTFIVDIESIKQSYKIKNLYSNLDRERSGLHDYTALALCLPKKQLKFGEFHCQDRLSIEAGVSKSDPIIELLPASTLNYTLERDISSRDLKLNVFITLSEVDYRLGEEASINTYKNRLSEWFLENDLEISDYSINYQVR